MDVATSTGLRPAIISNVEGDQFTGYLVNHHKHYVILGTTSEFLDGVVIVHPERAVVVSGQESDVLVFKDDEGIYVCVVGDEGRGRFVKSVPGALKVVSDYLYNLEEYEIAQDLRDRSSFYEPYLANLLQVQD